MEKKLSFFLFWLALCSSCAWADTLICDDDNQTGSFYRIRISRSSPRFEFSALNGLKASWNSPSQLQSWFGDPCTDKWLGVTCNGLQPHERVISLDLSFMNLEGEISPLFAELSSLETLQLSGNNFRGELPRALGTLSALRHLHLDGNHLSGPVPVEMGYLVNLQSLTVSGNHLSGDISGAVKHLPRLSHLNFGVHSGDGVGSHRAESMVASDYFVKLFMPRAVERRMDLEVPPGASPAASAAPPLASPRQLPPPQTAPPPLTPLPKPPPFAKAPAPGPAAPPSPPPISRAPLPAPGGPAKAPLHSPVKAPTRAPSQTPKPPPPSSRPRPAPLASRPSSPPTQPPVLPPSGAPPPNTLASPNPPAYTTPVAPPPPAPPPPCPPCGSVGQLALPGSCQCVYPLLVNFKLTMNFTNFTPASQKTFLTQLATSFQASPSQLLLLQARAGSVYANVALVPLPPATQLNASAVTLAVAVLGGLNGSALQLDPQFGTVSVLSLTQPFATAGPSTVTPLLPPPPAAKSSAFPTAAIIGIAIGAAVLAFLVVLIIFCFCCCCNKRRGPPPVPDAAKDYAPPRSTLATAATASMAPAAAPVGGGWATSAAGNGRGGSSGDASPATAAMLPLMSRREERNAPALMVGPRGLSSRGSSPGIGGVSPGGGGASRGAVASPGSRKPSLVVPGAQEFTLPDLQQATNSFAQDNRVAEGPLGSSYRADFAQGRALAIQRMEPSVVYGLSNEDFKAIVANIARLRHPNVVELHGYCIDYGERLLAFQYFSNKTLFDFLHDPSKQAVMTWETRIRIAIGAARALEYMHEQVAPAVVHRNVKSTIIHLDRDLSPHLADCGMAIFNPMEDNAIQGGGGFNYSAPEYSMTGVYTVKSDVYSFGIVLLELLTGRVPTDLSQPKSEQSLVKWAAPLLHDLNELERMMDPQLAGARPDATPLTRFAEVITRCVQPEPEFRPPMSKVVQDLVKRVSKSSRRGGTDGNSPGDASFQGSPGGGGWA